MFDVNRIRQDFPILEEKYMESRWYIWIMGLPVSVRFRLLKK